MLVFIVGCTTVGSTAIGCTVKGMLVVVVVVVVLTDGTDIGETDNELMFVVVVFEFVIIIGSIVCVVVTTVWLFEFWVVEEVGGNAKLVFDISLANWLLLELLEAFAKVNISPTNVEKSTVVLLVLLVLLEVLESFMKVSTSPVNAEKFTVVILVLLVLALLLVLGGV